VATPSASSGFRLIRLAALGAVSALPAFAEAKLQLRAGGPAEKE
jgi:hypothetical protein